MAKSNSKPAPKKKPPRRNRRRVESSGIVPLLFLGIMVLGMLRWQAAILFLFFMIPTFVLAATGRDTYHNEKLMTVMLMNVSGILPFAMQVWARPEMFEYVLFDMVKIALMLGAAGAGYLLLWAGPVVAATILQALNEDRLKKIAAERKELVELYGPEVLGDEAKAVPKA